MSRKLRSGEKIIGPPPPPKKRRLSEPLIIFKKLPEEFSLDQLNMQEVLFHYFYVRKFEIKSKKVKPSTVFKLIIEKIFRKTQDLASDQKKNNNATSQKVLRSKGHV